MQSPRQRLNHAFHLLFTAALLSSPMLCAGASLAGESSGQPAASAAPPPGSAAPPGDGAAPTPGSWQKHEYTFQYMGFTSTYSCDGLADKLKVLLRAAGARADLKSQPGVCAAGLGRPDKFAQAYLTFYTLAPLASNPAEANEGSAPGSWRAVTFASRSPRELAVGDCELVEQFRVKVVPMFATRDVDSHTTCIPHQESGSVINLKFQVFAAVAKQAQPRSSASSTPKERAQ